MKLKTIIFAAIVLFLPSCIKDGDEDKTLGVGDSLPQFSVTMNDGTTICTDDLDGKVSLILFFNTSCPDCQEELPVVEQLYRDYGIGGDGTEEVLFVCISREESDDSVSAYWEENGLTLPYSPQEDRSVYSLFATATIPRIFISDEDKIIRGTFTDSPLPTYEMVEQIITNLL